MSLILAASNFAFGVAHVSTSVSVPAFAVDLAACAQIGLKITIPAKSKIHAEMRQFFVKRVIKNDPPLNFEDFVKTLLPSPTLSLVLNIVLSQSPPLVLFFSGEFFVIIPAIKDVNFRRHRQLSDV
jgi:hypothetical protein